MKVETTVVADTSNAALIPELPQQRLDQLLTTTSVALGWGMVAALGVQASGLGGRVVSVVGDASFVRTPGDVGRCQRRGGTTGDC